MLPPVLFWMKIYICRACNDLALQTALYTTFRPVFEESAQKRPRTIYCLIK
jgi:hypothetical protein